MQRYIASGRDRPDWMRRKKGAYEHDRYRVAAHALGTRRSGRLGCAEQTGAKQCVRLGASDSGR